MLTQTHSLTSEMTASPEPCREERKDWSVSLRQVRPPAADWGRGDSAPALASASMPLSMDMDMGLVSSSCSWLSKSLRAPSHGGRQSCKVHAQAQGVQRGLVRCECRLTVSMALHGVHSLDREIAFARHESLGRVELWFVVIRRG